MEPKKITVVKASGEELRVKLSNGDEYQKLLDNYGVTYLIEEGDEFLIYGFDSLDHEGRYTLGCTKEPNGKLRCCSRIQFCIQFLLEYGNLSCSCIESQSHSHSRILQSLLFKQRIHRSQKRPRSVAMRCWILLLEIRRDERAWRPNIVVKCQM
jgi:hypothetical protein